MNRRNFLKQAGLLALGAMVPMPPLVAPQVLFEGFEPFVIGAVPDDSLYFVDIGEWTSVTVNIGTDVIGGYTLPDDVAAEMLSRLGLDSESKTPSPRMHGEG